MSKLNPVTGYPIMSLETIYLSYDIEADGPAPGLASMLNVGMVGLTTSGDVVFEYEANLVPLDNTKYNIDNNEFWCRPEQASALTYISKNRKSPEVVMSELSELLIALKSKYNVIPIAYPAAYDWQWINWYFWRFTNGNPLGYASRDMSSYICGLNKSLICGVVIGDVTLPPKYQKLPKHSGLIDAYVQGMWFVRTVHK